MTAGNEAHRVNHRGTGLAVLRRALVMLGPFSIDTIFPGFPDIDAA